MRESLSKRTKSRSASPSATLKRSSKPLGRKSAKVSLREQLPTKPAASKPAVKVRSTKQEPTLAKKKIAGTKAKKPSSRTAIAPVTQKATAKTSNKPVKAAKTPSKSVKSATPSVKVQPKSQKRLKPTAKPVAPKLITKPGVAVRKIPRQQIATQALRAFERAVKTFNLRQFSEAKALFEELQQHFHQEVEIISRSQTYIQVCNVRLAENRSLPRNADEFYDCGVVALNVGNFAQARTFFEKALKLRPDDSHTLYSLAATYAQTGSMDQALRYLEQAVQKQPRLRQRALQDTDFSMLKDNRRFLELLGATSPFDRLDARREFS